MIKHNFKELDIWKLSFQLSVLILKEIKSSKNFALKDQITRSAISIPSNIAEGSQRNSNVDFIRFLHIAKGSAAELYTQLLIAKELEELEISKCNDYLDQITLISSKNHSFIKYLKNKK